MSINDENLNIGNSLPSSNTKRVVLIMLGIVVFIILLILIVLSITKNNKKNDNKEISQSIKTINNETANKVAENISGTPSEFGSVDLPLVNQFKLKKDYQNNLTEIISDLEKEIESVGGLDKLDGQKVHDVKDKIMKEIVPREYQIIHMNFVLTLDKILRNDFATVDSDIKKVKMGI